MRIWEFYLAYCEAAFDTGDISLVQYTLVKPITMKKIAACALLACANGIFFHQVQAAALPPDLQSLLPAAALAGQAKMTVWGFEVYHATLWTSPGFWRAPTNSTCSRWNWQYLRDFAGSRHCQAVHCRDAAPSPLATEVQTRWEAQMRALFPDVKAGDRITGVNQPGVGAAFWHNGKALGDVRDVPFAQQFFGIWLSPQTSEPHLRQALLAQVPPGRGHRHFWHWRRHDRF